MRVAAFIEKLTTHQSTSTVEFHQKIQQMEKSHWGEPSYPLNNDVQGKQKYYVCLGCRKKGLIIIVRAIFLPTFGLSSQELQGLNNQIRPTRNS